MNDQTQSVDGTEVAEKAPAKEIIRGRMPVAVVHMVRFGSMKDQATKAKADAFGTTVGKVDDIAKNRNFAYVTEDFRPNEQQKADALAWLQRHPTNADSLIAELNGVDVATPEQTAAFEAARTAARGSAAPATAEDGTPVDAGGGNRRSRGKKGAAVEAAPEDGEALLR